MGGKRPKTRWIDQIRKVIQYERGKYKKTGSERIETAGYFSVIVDPYLWKLLKNDDEDDDDEYILVIHHFTMQKNRVIQKMFLHITLLNK